MKTNCVDDVPQKNPKKEWTNERQQRDRRRIASSDQMCERNFDKFLMRIKSVL